MSLPRFTLCSAHALPRTVLAAALLAILLTACRREPDALDDYLGADPAPSADIREPAAEVATWDQQVEQVRRGESQRIATRQPVSPAMLQQLAGLDDLQELDLGETELTAEGLEALASLQQLRVLQLHATAVDDSAFEAFGKLPELRRLNLPAGVFTDRALSHLEHLPHLESLRFRSPHVTDAGMKSIRKLPRLRFLHLIDVPVTDTGLEHLHGMEQLESLYLDQSKVTVSGLKKLLDSVPQSIHIHLDQQHPTRLEAEA